MTKKDHEQTVNKNAGKTRKDGMPVGTPFTPKDQPSPEAKKAGWAKAKTRKDLADMLFQQLTSLGTFDKAMTQIDKKVDDGTLKELIDVTRIISPPDKQEIGGEVHHSHSLFIEKAKGRANNVQQRNIGSDKKKPG